MKKNSFRKAASGIVIADPVIVINAVALRAMETPVRSEVLEAIHQVVASGIRPILSVREHDYGMDEMMALRMPAMVPDADKRKHFYHDDQLLFSRQELVLGERGIMKKPQADLYIALDTYARDIPHVAYIDVKSDNVRDQVLAAFTQAKAMDPLLPSPAIG